MVANAPWNGSEPDRQARLSIAPSWFSPAVQDQLARARREVDAAARADRPDERFRHAHLAALRAASAVLAVRATHGPRRRPQPVWELLASAAPELGAWAAFFRGGAAVRAAIEAGREPEVSAERAEHQLAMARTFLGMVEDSALPRAS